MPVSPPEHIEAQPVPAALWQRFVAFLVDAAILALPTLGLGLVYFDVAAALGNMGPLVGLVLTLLYFTFFDSWWGEGRSPGKRLLHISVMRIDAALLTPAIAALRVLIIYIPFLLNGMTFDGDPSVLVAGLLLLLKFGILLCLAYLFLFNQSRRSVHDLITGAIVVNARTPLSPFTRPIWRGHWLVVSCICALTFATPLISSVFDVGPSQETLQLRAIRTSVAALPSVRTAQVGWGSTSLATLRTGTRHSNRLRIVVELRTRPLNFDAIARQIEDAIFTEHAERVGQAEVLIVMRYGFNFGIAVASQDVGVITSVAKWRGKTRRTQT